MPLLSFPNTGEPTVSVHTATQRPQIAAEMIGSLGLGGSLVSFRAVTEGVFDPGLVGRVLGNGEAKRNDDEYSYVAAWEFKGVGKPPALHKEPLVFEEVHPSVRSYK